MKRFASIVLWSAIAAAFIGPGTVTTAASAGAGFGYTLLWAVLLSVIATYVLQEMAARISIASGQDLAQFLRDRFADGAQKWLVTGLVAGAILLGCAAYQAGNILGGVAGVMLGLELPSALVTLAITLGAGLMLALGSPQRIAQVLAFIVALMGIGFLAVAITLSPPLGQLLRGLTLPQVPDGASLIVVALIGTTVVPYNLFLGSSLARGTDLAATRFGLAVAIGLGGLITAAILVTGAAIAGEFSFDALADLLAREVGEWARTAFALALFAAGLSSAVTAPLAAALTARGLFARIGDPAFEPTGWKFRAVWLLVLAIGAGFALTDVRPAAAIVAAQAFNGLLLPFVAAFLLYAANDRHLLAGRANGIAANLAGGAVALCAFGLGAAALWRAAQSTVG